MNTELAYLFPDDRKPIQLVAREPDFKLEMAICASEGMSDAILPQEIRELARLAARARQQELQLH
ncbi:MAG TPA: hypothetical protein VH599_17925 [Ktedonobacterales bacterium]|jgi:hypothetical protein